MPKYYTKAGRLTSYALACGYIEQQEYGGIRTTLWADGPTYCVRQYNFNEHKLVTWEFFNTLTAARKHYDCLVKHSKE